jgi:hypothetical protein
MTFGMTPDKAKVSGPSQQGGGPTQKRKIPAVEVTFMSLAPPMSACRLAFELEIIRP